VIEIESPDEKNG